MVFVHTWATLGWKTRTKLTYVRSNNDDNERLGCEWKRLHMQFKQNVKVSTSTRGQTDPPWWRGWVAPPAEDHRSYNHTCVHGPTSVFKECHRSAHAQHKTMHIQDNTKARTTPCVANSKISLCRTGGARYNIGKVYAVFNGANHNTGFYIRKKGARRHALSAPLVISHSVCIAHFLVRH